jgi:hypothetical protein
MNAGLGTLCYYWVDMLYRGLGVETGRERWSISMLYGDIRLGLGDWLDWVAGKLNCCAWRSFVLRRIQ